MNNLIVILHVTVNVVATLFCSSSVKPPTSSTRPCLHVSTHSTMSKSCQFFYGYQSWQNSYRIYGVIFICIESNKYPIGLTGTSVTTCKAIWRENERTTMLCTFYGGYCSLWPNRTARSLSRAWPSLPRAHNHIGGATTVPLHHKKCLLCYVLIYMVVGFTPEDIRGLTVDLINSCRNRPIASESATWWSSSVFRVLTIGIATLHST